MESDSKNWTAYQWAKKVKSHIKKRTGRDVDVFVRFKKDPSPGELFLKEEERESLYREALEVFDGEV